MADRILRFLPVLPALALALVLVVVWAGRFLYPFDLEWMESGMLAHAWRVDRGLPLYVRPNVDFIPYVYPPGYPWVVAALGKVFGLSLPLGRAVSLASALAAAGALAFGVRRAGGSGVLAAGTALVFLGTFPQAGAFYDLVRPDALAMALLGWAVVVGLEERRGAPVIAGLLLAAAFLVKQNTAIAGVPMLLGLALRGWRPALAFAVASVAPALASVVLLQLATDGQFLVWLIEVPGSQRLVWTRAWVDTPREWGTALPVALAACGLLTCYDATARQRGIPAPIAAAVPIWLGMACAWWGTYEPPPPDAPVYNVPAAFAWWAIAAIPAALAVRAVGTALDRTARDLPSWRIVYGGGVLFALAGMALMMRVHDGGYINVHTPLFWSAAAAFGAVLVHVERTVSPGLAGVALAAQLAWSTALVRPGRLVPADDDVAMGWKFVDEIRGVDGPILSPFSAWMPVYAGKPPSLHAQGVWDVNYPGGPFHDDLVVIEQALRDHHWTMIIGGQSTFLGDLTQHYEVSRELLPPDDPRLMPRTGIHARPWRLLVPRQGAR